MSKLKVTGLTFATTKAPFYANAKSDKFPGSNHASSFPPPVPLNACHEGY